MGVILRMPKKNEAFGRATVKTPIGKGTHKLQSGKWILNDIVFDWSLVEPSKAGINWLTRRSKMQRRIALSDWFAADWAFRMCLGG
jgi:hypothetical protein